MMRMTQGWTGLRTAVVALGLVASAQTGVNAAAISATTATSGTANDSILGYSTAGSIDTTTAADGVSGTNVISFVPITNSQVSATSNVPLGFFQVAAEPTGQSTTYTNTPFSINFIPATIAGETPTSSNPVTITGVFNGTITGSNQSSVVATFNTFNGVSTLNTASGTFASSLSIPQSNMLPLVPSSAGSGATTVEGMIATTLSPNNEVPAPEPSTIALFLSTICGLGLRKYVLGRRQRGQA
jgi:hypothetical protein